MRGLVFKAVTGADIWADLLHTFLFYLQYSFSTRLIISYLFVLIPCGRWYIFATFTKRRSRRTYLLTYYMAMLTVALSIGLLLALIAGLRLNAFIALFITALAAGLLHGMPTAALLKSVQQGIGSTLGPLAAVLGFGVMLGKVLTESGAAQRLTQTLVGVFGIRNAGLALCLTGFTVGLAMFYNAGFVVLLPLVLTLATQTNLPLLPLAISMASALSVTHGFLPPHPGPTAVAALLKADLGRTLLYGLVIAVPTLAVAGVLFPRYLPVQAQRVPTHLFPTALRPEASLPSFGVSLLCAILPVLLMLPTTVAEMTLPTGHWLRFILAFVGDPGVAMLLSLLSATALLWVVRGLPMSVLNGHLEQSVGAVAMILLIIGGGGAFKQVLNDAGIGEQLATLLRSAAWSPLVTGWVTAALIRVTLGSATVAGLMTGGLMAPIVVQTGVSPELMTLSIGAGSLMLSHVNDTGFWMFKEYFGLSLRETFFSWSLMETLVSTLGLFGALFLNFIIN